MFENKLGLPVLLIATTLVLMTSFQMYQIMEERRVIKETYASQEEPLKQTKQVRTQFEGIVKGTSALADKGNESAKAVMADLARIGLKKNEEAAAATPAAAPAAPAAPVAPAAQ